MLGLYPEAMRMLAIKKIRNPQAWLTAINELIKQREQQYLNEHFSDLKGTLLLIDSKNYKMYAIDHQKIEEYHLSKTED